MSQIDALLQFLLDQQGHEILIPADDNCYIIDANGRHALNRVLSASEIASLILEVLPAEQKQDWEARHDFSFLRRIDAGEFRIEVAFQEGQLLLRLARTPLQYIENLCRQARALNASDILLQEGSPIFLRREGNVEQFAETAPLPQGTLNAYLSTQSAITNESKTQFLTTVGMSGRVRCSVLPGLSGTAVTLHVLPDNIPPLEGLPAPFRALLQEKSGLILVSTLPGQGLTQLLTSLISLRATMNAAYITTIERFAEIPFESAKSLVVRSTPADEHAYAAAIDTALQLHPDVLLVDIIPDEAALRSIFTAIDRNCLVIAGYLADSVTEAVNRLLHSLPADTRDEIRLDLARVLRGAIAQVLCPDIEGKQVAAQDVLIGSAASAEAIKKDRLEDLGEGIRSVGFSRDDSLLRLFQDGKISAEAATEAASDRKRIKAELETRMHRMEKPSPFSG